jgi:hypothetical protein
VALVFGHFGQELSVAIRDLGLVCSSHRWD